MVERKRGTAAPSTDSIVSGASWYASDISGQVHSRVKFVDLDLMEVQNDGATFTECTFRGAKFNASVHSNAAFLNCTFTGCNFFDASFTECKFVGSSFDRCTFDIVKVTGGNWSLVGLPGADLRSAVFRDVRMSECDLTRARCEGGFMRDVDLSGAWLDSANFSGCDLRGSDLSAVEPAATRLSGAIVTVHQAIVLAAALGLDIRDD